MMADNFVFDLIDKYDFPDWQFIPIGKGESNPIISDNVIDEIAKKENKIKAQNLNRRLELKAIKKYVP